MSPVSSDPRRPDRTLVVSVSSSSKKAGKSTLASYLVKELGADYGLKVSSGGAHGPEGLVSDRDLISAPGTDTGALVEAGATLVLWVNAPPGELERELDEAMGAFRGGGILIVEGNSALAHIKSDFAVFLMSVPFSTFKPSALAALAKADLVLVNLAGELAVADVGSLAGELAERAPGAKVLFFEEGQFESAMRKAAHMARLTLGTDP
jgi:hypothetical protein